MELDALEAEMKSGRVMFAVIDEDGRVLYRAADSNEYMSRGSIPGAAAHVADGSPAEEPLLAHRRRPLPERLIRAAAARSWRIEPFPGWDE